MKVVEPTVLQNGVPIYPEGWKVYEMRYRWNPDMKRADKAQVVALGERSVYFAAPGGVFEVRNPNEWVLKRPYLREIGWIGLKVLFIPPAFVIWAFYCFARNFGPLIRGLF